MLNFICKGLSPANSLFRLVVNYFIKIPIGSRGSILKILDFNKISKSDILN